MKSKIVLENGNEYECEISKTLNKLKLVFDDSKYVPWEILRNGSFTVNIQAEEDDIGCGKCETCLTPIC